MNAVLEGDPVNILSRVGEIVSAGMTWLGQAASTVTNNDLLLTFTCVGLVGTGIGLLRRIIG